MSVEYFRENPPLFVSPIYQTETIDSAGRKVVSCFMILQGAAAPLTLTYADETKASESHEHMCNVTNSFSVPTIPMFEAIVALMKNLIKAS